MTSSQIRKMKTDKKFQILKTIFLAFALFLLICPQVIFAAGPKASLPGEVVGGVQGGLDITADQAGVSKDTDLPSILGKLINYLFGIVAVIFLTITLVGGFIWMTAGGSEENVKKAKSFIVNGINGMIVIFLAYALVYVILSALNAAIGGPAK